MSDTSTFASLSIGAAATALRSRQLSAVELIRMVLERLARSEPMLRAYVEVRAEEAISMANSADAAFARGEDVSPLQGIPIAVKDIFDWEGLPTRCGSPLFASKAPARQDCAPVERLRQAGAVLLGKTVTQEFAAGVVSAPARNPWEPGRIPGGSSGGSAAAVAVGSALGALGSDTGGSIRIPASVTGTAGLKPTYGRVSKRGVFPLSWSLDTVGPIARTVEDTALMTDILAGYDPNDPTTISRPPPRCLAELPPNREEPGSLNGLRLGVPRAYFFDRLKPGVAAAVEQAIIFVRQLGAEVIDVDWSDAAAARTVGYLISRAESASVHQDRFNATPSGLGDELRARVAVGLRMPASDYLLALRARQVVKRSMARLFADRQLDALICPSTPETAIGADYLFVDWDDGPESVIAAYTRLTTPFNATGQPALSLSCGFDGAGLPVGLQIAGRPFREATLCRIGHVYERAAGWWRHRPPM